MSEKFVGIYRGWNDPAEPQKVRKTWVAEYPDPQGKDRHKTLAEAFKSARKNGYTPYRWYGCDAEVAS